MRSRSRGSILLLALVSVSVATTLALALAIWVSAQQRQLREVQLRRQARRHLHNAIVNKLPPLGTDPTTAPERGSGSSEPSRSAASYLQAWEESLAEWHFTFTGEGTPAAHGNVSNLTTSQGGLPSVRGAPPLQDESGGKVNIAKAPPELLTALIGHLLGTTRGQASHYARRIHDWCDSDDRATGEDNLSEAEAYGSRQEPWNAPNRPLAVIEELTLMPGLSDSDYAALLPNLTTYGDGKINLNTAPPAILEAAFSLSPAVSEAPQRLLARIVEFRKAGRSFTTLPTIAGALGNPPADEALLLSYLMPFLTLEPVVIGGTATAYYRESPATPPRPILRLSFIWSRQNSRFERWLEE